MNLLYPNDIFHIHTYRCRHAEDVDDEVYVEKAIDLCAKGLWFTDHAPFPGDPFRNRMRYDQLEEYLDSLTSLKEKYKGTIDIHIGLEIEYLSSFNTSGYYRRLKEDLRIESLLLGQHMAEDSRLPGLYTFAWKKDKLEMNEFRALGRAEVAGIRSGYFDVVAHPDRIFRRCKQWTPEMDAIADRIIAEAIKKDIPLELNMHSIRCKGHYWKQFWDKVPDDANVLIGLDAHSVPDLERRYQRSRSWIDQ